MATENSLNINSKNIKVFPTTKRNDNFDRNARLPSEYNLTSIVNRLTSRDSFIISGLDINNSTNKLNPGTCNIHGYYFVIGDTGSDPGTVDITTLTDAVKTMSSADSSKLYTLCLSISTKNTDISVYDGSTITFTELIGTDSNDVYTGLKLTIDDNGHVNPRIDGANSTYHLPIAIWDNKKGEWIRNEFSLLKYSASDVSIVVPEGLALNEGQQSLTGWLNNLIIDDGEI